MNQVNNKIIFEVIDEHNSESAAECLSYMFYNFEPVSSHLGFEWNSYRKMMSRFFRVIATNGLCFLAKDTEYNKTIGVITSIDTIIDYGEKFVGESESFYDVLEKLAPDIAMTSELERNYLDKMNFNPGECLHLFQCGILPEYSGQHIATALVNLTLKTGVDAGYKYAMSDCTSIISKKIFDGLGFNLENKIRYSDFVYKSEKIFSDIDGEYYLMTKKII